MLLLKGLIIEEGLVECSKPSAWPASCVTTARRLFVPAATGFLADQRTFVDIVMLCPLLVVDPIAGRLTAPGPTVMSAAWLAPAGVTDSRVAPFGTGAVAAAHTLKALCTICAVFGTF